MLVFVHFACLLWNNCLCAEQGRPKWQSRFRYNREIDSTTASSKIEVRFIAKSFGILSISVQAGNPLLFFRMFGPLEMGDYKSF